MHVSYPKSAGSGQLPLRVLSCLAVLSWAAHAEATIGPPVKIRMSADTKQAVSGEAYEEIGRAHV